jgi:phosphate uptake regulator
MEQRKIMPAGKSSLVVSLPKEWMQLNDVKKGDTVSVGIQRDRSLVIYPNAQKKPLPKEITLSIGAKEEDLLLSQKMLGAFLDGYSGIVLTSENIFTVNQTKTIRRMAGKLYLRVMEADEKCVYVQSLTDESKASLEQAVQRMHLISRSMIDGAIKALKNSDIELSKSVIALDDDVDHFSYFNLRLLRDAAQNPTLANELHLDPLDCMDYQILVYRMEYAGDYAADIARHIIMLNGVKQKIPEDVLSIMISTGKDVLDLYTKGLKAFFDKDIIEAVEIMKYGQKMDKAEIDIATKSFTGPSKGADLVCGICSIRDDIKRLCHCAFAMAEMTVNRAFKESNPEPNLGAESISE